MERKISLDDVRKAVENAYEAVKSEMFLLPLIL